MTAAQEPQTLLGDPVALRGPGAARQLSGRLGVGSIVFMVVAAAAPLTVIGGGFPVAVLLGNGAGVPSMFAIGAIILLFFAVGLSAMSRFIPRPGAFFTYVGYGMGRPLGLAAAYLALLTYTTVQVAVYGYLGATLESSVVALHGPDIPWYVYSLAMIALVGVLGYRHIELSSRVLGVLLIAEVGIVIVLSVVIIGTGGAEGLSLAPFEPSTVLSGSPGIGLMFALAGFIGFESTAIFRDEAKEPEKTIPRATYIAVIAIGLFYTFASWALVMGWGPAKIVDVVASDTGGFIVNTAVHYLGTVGGVIVNVLLITSLFACVLSFHNVVTRYQHSMSNASVFPAMIGRVHGKHSSPYVSSLVQTVTAAVLIAAFALFRLDPVLQVFTWFSGIATLAIVVLMALTCLAVIIYFARKKTGAGLWRTVIAPVIGLLGLVGVTLIIVDNFPLLIGDVDAKGTPVLGPLSIAFFAAMLAFPVIGVVQALILRRTRRDAYQNIIDTISA
ncbi:APC family permease [Leifsonia shinshuensis]|uniref:APC family permease n=1 Tax=Leifsonia TaxID=110932 RepID=UPI00285FEF1D|nr:APC family permease [Leifsonia shinshuensis]MDR6969782.1 amino acid transporter [Leifsonia shinshuensis]